MGMAEGVLAADGIPNLSVDDQGEIESSHPAAAQTEVKHCSANNSSGLS